MWTHRLLFILVIGYLAQPLKTQATDEQPQYGAILTSIQVDDFDNHAPLPIKDKSCCSQIKKGCKVALKSSLLVISYVFMNIGFQGVIDHIPEQYGLAIKSLNMIQLTLNLVLTAPFFLPLQSRLNRMVFDFANTGEKPRKQKDENLTNEFQNEFESLWWETQKTLTQNAQMSRQLITHMILIIKQNIQLQAAHLSQCCPDAMDASMARLLCHQYYELKNLFPDIALHRKWVSCTYQENLGVLYPSFNFQSSQFQEHLKIQVDLNSQEDKNQDLQRIQTWLPKVSTLS